MHSNTRIPSSDPTGLHPRPTGGPFSEGSYLSAWGCSRHILCPNRQGGDEEDSTSISNMTDSTEESPATKKKRRKEKQHRRGFDKKFGIIYQKKNENEKNTSHLFGKYIGQCLINMDERTRTICQHKINDIIFQSQIGNFTPNPPQQPSTSWPLYPHQSNPIRITPLDTL